MYLLIALPGDIEQYKLDLAASPVLLQQQVQLLRVIPGTLLSPGREDLVQNERAPAGVPAYGRPAAV